MATLIANPEGQMMPMNTVQGGLEDMHAYCSSGHRRDGINYPTPGGGCTVCIYESAGVQMPSSGLPIPSVDVDAVLRQRSARDAQPVQGDSPLYR